MALDDKRYPGFDPRYKDVQGLPRTESLKDTLQRVLPFWQSLIAPELLAGKSVLIVSHGNTIRALIKHLEGISDRDIEDVEMPTASPLVYELDGDLRHKRRFFLSGGDDASRAANRE
jgi:2,3-bisphosphoglycerate-dependent phosphoglycerate mutase